jgi:hypothetical protein
MLRRKKETGILKNYGLKIKTNYRNYGIANELKIKNNGASVAVVQLDRQINLRGRLNARRRRRACNVNVQLHVIGLWLADAKVELLLFEVQVTLFPLVGFLYPLKGEEN